MRIEEVSEKLLKETLESARDGIDHQGRCICECRSTVGIVQLDDGRKAQVTITINTDQEEWD